MTPEDLAALHARAMTLTAAWGAPTMRGFVDAPGSVLVTRGQAFALGRVIAQDAELLTLAVDPSIQGQGFGRKCLRAFEDTAAARGARQVFLEVAAPNDVAIGLYASVGYTRTGRRKRYYKTPDGQHLDALIMTKPLQSP